MRRKRAQKKNMQPEVQAELDLHGHTSCEAEGAVEDFLYECKEQGLTRIRIIVGKGTHSRDNQAVLPNVVKNLLTEYDLTYTYAKIQDGGEGALEVTL
jgi:DNA-nicking Smr family endonuclease